MFYGIINETYSKTDYLEMELKNSLLFFESLNVVQESGIQIVQESFSDIKEKIKDLWERFKEWFRGIWEKIKGLFSKNENTVAEAKAMNDKIQKGEVKKEEPKKEESKNEEPKEIKWYEFNIDEFKKLEKEIKDSNDETNFYKFINSLGLKDNEELSEDQINSYFDKLDSVINQFTNIDIKHRFFKENTFSNKVAPEQFRSLADKITKAITDFVVEKGNIERDYKILQQQIDDTDKLYKELEKQKVGDNGYITDEKDGFIISLNNYNRIMSKITSMSHSMADILPRIQVECSNCIEANHAALKGITLYFS